jgi:hypothetical protein
VLRSNWAGEVVVVALPGAQSGVPGVQGYRSRRARRSKALC